MPQINTRRLSEKAFTRFKEIYEEEFHEVIPDDELHAMGFRLLDLLDLLLEPAPEQTKKEPVLFVSEQEHKVLKFLHLAIHHEGQSPTVRDVAKALGFRSSRSGARMINKLIERGLVYRDEEGKLQLAEHVRECGVVFETKI